MSNSSKTETVTFSLGCFWDPDARFGILDGVLITRVGYCGGTHPPTPTYRSIGDYTESVQIDFDPTRISFAQLLSYFNQWHIPNTPKTRSQYAAAIFYHNEEQQRQVNEMNIVDVRVDKFDKFYEAEDYHQKHNFKQTTMKTDLFGKKEEWANKDKQMITKLNGFLAGYGTNEQFQQWDKRRELTREQQNYIKDKLT
jgi:methionine-S-sulfoxide reductase